MCVGRKVKVPQGSLLRIQEICTVADVSSSEGVCLVWSHYSVSLSHASHHKTEQGPKVFYPQNVPDSDRNAVPFWSKSGDIRETSHQEYWISQGDDWIHWSSDSNGRDQVHSLLHYELRNRAKEQRAASKGTENVGRINFFDEYGLLQALTTKTMI